MKIAYRLISVIITLILISSFVDKSYSGNIIVDPSLGNDNSGNGTLNNPYKTLWKAGQIAVGGDSVLIRGGHHQSFRDIFIRINPHTSSKIFIMPYNHEQVILDGTGHQFEATWDAILTIDSSRYIEVRDLVIMNNDSGPGLRVVSDSNWSSPGAIYITRFVNVVNCKTFNTNNQGILIQAKNVNVDSCEVGYAVLSNEGQKSNSGWGSALCTYPFPLSMGRCDSVNFRNNYVHHSWGEGIAQIRGNQYTIENNKIVDCFSAYIYSDNCKNGIIRNNTMQSTNDAYNRTFDAGY
ncbi:MAG: right-handed parallel beta-helix repeat-containing protein, partial [bacterium]